MYIQSDFSVYTIKSWNPGFKIEISCNSLQESSNPLVDMLFDGLFSMCIIFLKKTLIIVVPQSWAYFITILLTAVIYFWMPISQFH